MKRIILKADSGLRDQMYRLHLGLIIHCVCLSKGAPVETHK